MGEQKHLICFGLKAYFRSSLDIQGFMISLALASIPSRDKIKRTEKCRNKHLQSLKINAKRKISFSLGFPQTSAGQNRTTSFTIENNVLQSEILHLDVFKKQTLFPFYSWSKCVLDCIFRNDVQIELWNRTMRFQLSTASKLSCDGGLFRISQPLRFETLVITTPRTDWFIVCS